MSTIRVVNIQHSDATEPNIVLEADGTTTFASGITISGGTNLTVSGTAEFASGTVSAPGITFIDDNNTGIYEPAADTVAITTAATERLRVDSAGNVGVGTSSPSAKLHISGGAENVVLQATNSSGSGFFGARNSAYGALGVGDTYIYNNGNDITVMAEGSSNVIKFASGGNTERLRIDSSGRLLINNTTNASTYPLQVTALSDANAICIIGRPSDDIGELKWFENDRTTALGEIQYRQDHVNFRHRVGDIRFATGGLTERMRIDSSGNVGIGGTATGNFGAIDKGVLITGSDAQVGLRVHTSNGSGGILEIYAENGGSMLDTRGSGHIRVGSAATEFMRIDSSGRLLVGTSSSPSAGAGQYAKLFSAGNTLSATGDGRLALARGNTAANLSSGNGIGELLYTDSTGGTFASIGANADAAPGTNDYPGRLVFSTTADGASSPTERMRIDSSGNMGLGKSSNLFYRLTFQEGAGDTSRIGWVSTSGNRKASIDCGNTSAIVFRIGGTDDERMRLDGSGRLLVGTSSARTKYFNGTSYGAITNFEGTSNSSRIVSFVHNDSSGGPMFVLGATGGSTAGSNALVSASVTYGFFSFQGSDGNELVEAARISAQADGTPSANDMPGRLVFLTTADGASSPTERMRIDSGGEVSITAFDNSTTNVALSLKHLNGTGKVQLDWGGNVRAVNTSGIQAIVSERRLKNNIQPIDTNQSWINARDIPWRIFEYLDNPGAKYTGHIVDEVEAIDPTLIFNTGQSDDEGPIRTYDNPLLNAMRFNALQEALKRIETLEASNADLLARVTALEGA